jgi:hypothetical protein
LCVVWSRDSRSVGDRSGLLLVVFNLKFGGDSLIGKEWFCTYWSGRTANCLVNAKLLSQLFDIAVLAQLYLTLSAVSYDADL